MEQFITGNVWKEVNKHLKKRQRKTACIAYVTAENLKLSKGDTLICDASTFAVKFGETSAKTIASYFKKGVKVFSNQQLHSKLLLTDSFVVIGSANLSTNSANNLIESSLLTDNEVLISQTKSFCHNLSEESILLDKEAIKDLLQIKVVKRPFKPTERSATRQKKFGNRYWFVSALELTDKRYDKIKDVVEETRISVSEATNIDEDEIAFLRYIGKTKFSQEAREGDQIILRMTNSANTRTYVYPPSTILKKEVRAGHFYFYHDDRNMVEHKMPWSKFQRLVKTLSLQKPITTRNKAIPENNVKKLRAVWGQ